jgi:hypothetical protein
VQLLVVILLSLGLLLLLLLLLRLVNLLVASRGSGVKRTR